MNATERLHIEVAYGRADVQCVIALTVASGTAIEDAIRASGVLARFPEIDLASAGVGVYGRRAALSDTVCDGDRIEIYRPLQVDPKEARRRRVRKRERGRETG